MNKYLITVLLIVGIFCFTKLMMKSDNVEKSIPRLLTLSSKESIPSQKMTPVLKELKTKYKGQLEVIFQDVGKTENRHFLSKYGFRSIPSLIYFNGEGKEIWRHSGFVSKDELLKKWKELGYSFKEMNQEIATK